MLDYRLEVHLQTYSFTTSECICEFIPLSLSGAPRIAPKHHLQPVQIYRVSMGTYTDIWIHRYIDT